VIVEAENTQKDRLSAREFFWQGGRADELSSLRESMLTCVTFLMLQTHDAPQNACCKTDKRSSGDFMIILTPNNAVIVNQILEIGLLNISKDPL
jgi:hypothetical protein